MTSLHARTTTLAVIDPRGLPIRSVAFARSVSGQAPARRVMQSVFDPMGRLVAQHDPRVFAHATAPANLLERIHLGAINHTLSMHIDPHNNRLMRSGETEHSYDANGNLLILQSGQSLQWDARNQLRAIAQVTRQHAANDEERYIYGGGGKRLRKVRTWQAQANSHTAETRYLPGLEVRTNSASQEQLEVVTLQAGRIAA